MTDPNADWEFDLPAESSDPPADDIDDGDADDTSATLSENGVAEEDATNADAPFQWPAHLIDPGPWEVGETHDDVGLSDSEVAPEAASDPDQQADTVRRKGDVEVLVEALAAGMTQKDAAAQAGMSERSASRWLGEDPEVAARVSARKAERRAERLHSIGQLGTQVLDGTSLALSEAMELARSEDPKVSLDAIRTLLQFGPKLHQTLDQERRLTELETTVDRVQTNPQAAPGARWPEE